MQIRHPGCLQCLLGLARALAGSANEDHRLGDTSPYLRPVLSECIERDVVGTSDMLGLEFTRGTDVEQARLGVILQETREVGGRKYEWQKGHVFQAIVFEY